MDLIHHVEGSFPFLALPREIRDVIYEEYTSYLNAEEFPQVSSLSPGLVNQQIRQEFRQALERHEWLIRHRLAFRNLQEYILIAYHVSITRVIFGESLFRDRISEKGKQRMVKILNRYPSIPHLTLEISNCDVSAKDCEEDIVYLLSQTLKNVITFRVRRFCDCGKNSKNCMCRSESFHANDCPRPLHICDKCGKIGRQEVCESEICMARRPSILHPKTHVHDKEVEERVLELMQRLREERQAVSELGLLEGLFDED